MEDIDRRLRFNHLQVRTNLRLFPSDFWLPRFRHFQILIRSSLFCSPSPSLSSSSSFFSDLGFVDQLSACELTFFGLIGMAVLLEEIVKSVELWLKLIKKPEPYVDPNLDPVLLVPGVAGSILNAVHEDTGKEERVWVRILGADAKFRTDLWSFYDPSSGNVIGFLFCFVH